MIFRKKGSPFLPTEIIFSVTEACNLHCPHCYVSRSPKKIDINDAKNLLLSCGDLQENPIERVGFSGGEPFLNLDFLIEMTKCVVEKDYLFDQITTNGDWWKSEEELKNTLQCLYDAGYDGKICLSWDAFHGQTSERMKIFIETCEEIFGAKSINIQCCIPYKYSEAKGVAGNVSPLEGVAEDDLSAGARGRPRLAEQDASPLEEKSSELFSKTDEILEYLRNYFPEISVYKLPQCFQACDCRAWTAKKWFKEDFCQGPGNILFVHANGNVAPCCGFANENPGLHIGTLKNSLEEILENAKSNSMISLCYEKGLSSLLKKRHFKKELPGKTDDICTFCDFVMKSDEISGKL